MNSIPNYQKKNRIFAKRERELIHAIKHGFPMEKVEVAAEKLRAAKMAVFKCRFARTTVHQPHKFSPEEMAARDAQVQKWLAMTTTDIIVMYRTSLP